MKNRPLCGRLFISEVEFSYEISKTVKDD